MDIASWPGLGTAILARLEPGPAPKNRETTQPPWGAVCAPMPGRGGVRRRLERRGRRRISNDHRRRRTRTWTRSGRRLGPGRAPVPASPGPPACRPCWITSTADCAPRAALPYRSRASIGRGRKIVFAGIGNVAGIVVADGGVRRMVSLPGTAGHNARKIQAFDYPLQAGIVILHSDGLGTSWSLDRYPGLARAHPTLMAAVLYRDFWRRRDDVTVVVASGVCGRMTWPIVTMPIDDRSRRGRRAAARALARGTAGLRTTGPDAHRHGRVGDCAQRLQLRRRRPRRVPDRVGIVAPDLRHSRQRSGQGHCRSRGCARRPRSFRRGNGPRPRRRADA